MSSEMAQKQRRGRKVRESLTHRAWRLERKRIWEDMTGCICTKVIEVDGKSVTLRSYEMCEKSAIRCNGRMVRWSKDAVKLGPEPPAP